MEAVGTGGDAGAGDDGSLGHFMDMTRAPNPIGQDDHSSPLTLDKSLFSIPALRGFGAVLQNLTKPTIRILVADQQRSACE